MSCSFCSISVHHEMQSFEFFEVIHFVCKYYSVPIVILVFVISVLSLFSCVRGHHIVSNKNSMIKNVCAFVSKGLGFLGCYTTAQNNHPNESLPWGGCSSSLQIHDCACSCNSWQQTEDEHGHESLPFFVFLRIKRKLFMSLILWHSWWTLFAKTVSQRWRWNCRGLFDSIVKFAKNFPIPQGDL